MDEALQEAFEQFMVDNPELWDTTTTILDLEEITLPFSEKESLKKTTISLDNYATFFVRKIDNDLSNAEIAALDAFLDKNPHLKGEVALFEKAKLNTDTTIVFEEKQALKKTETVITADNYAHYIVLELDNELGEYESKKLAQFIATNKKYEQEKELYAKSRLVAHPVLFEDKELLKNIGSRKKNGLFYYISIAASILVLLGIGIVFLNQAKDEATSISLSNINTLDALVKKTAPVISHSTNTTNGITAKPKSESSREHKFASNATKKRKRKNRVSATPEPQVPIAKEQITPDTLTTTIYAATSIDTNDVGSATFSANTENALPVAPQTYYIYEKVAVEKKSTWIKQVLTKKDSKTEKQKNGFTQLLAKTVARLTNKKIIYTPSYNEYNELVAYSIQTPGFAMSKNIGNEEE